MIKALSFLKAPYCWPPAASSQLYTEKLLRRSPRFLRSPVSVTSGICSTHRDDLSTLRSATGLTMLTPISKLGCLIPGFLQLTQKENSSRRKLKGTSPRTATWVNWWNISFPCCLWRAAGPLLLTVPSTAASHTGRSPCQNWTLMLCYRLGHAHTNTTVIGPFTLLFPQHDGI